MQRQSIKYVHKSTCKQINTETKDAVLYRTEQETNHTHTKTNLYIHA